MFQEKACDAMEILDELIECEVGLVVPYIGSIVEVCVEVTLDFVCSSCLEDNGSVSVFHPSVLWGIGACSFLTLYLGEIRFAKVLQRWFGASANEIVSIVWGRCQ